MGTPTRRRRAAALTAAALLIGCRPVAEQTSKHPASGAPAITEVRLPGRPFQALPTRDGKWILVSLPQTDSGKPGIAVLKRTAGTASLVRLVPLDAPPTGMVLTHDGKLLIAAANERLAFLDVARLVDGGPGKVLGYLDETRAGTRLARVYANVSPDDRYLFSSDERARTITVVALEEARASHYSASAIVGTIPVGNAPIDLAFSKDGRTLFSTSQAMPPRFGWPLECRREGTSPGTPPSHTQGAIGVIDVARAEKDPAHSVVRFVPAGCNPVRLVLSPRGDVAYVSARGDDALLAFDTERLVSDPGHALFGRVPVGPSPVGVAVFDSGRRVLVTSSDRFAGHADDRQPVYVVDATRIAAGAKAVLGTLTAGAFPRELRVTADGKTLLLTNFRSKTLELVDLTHLPLAPIAH